MRSKKRPDIDFWYLKSHNGEYSLYMPTTHDWNYLSYRFERWDNYIKIPISLKYLKLNGISL